MNIVFSAAHNGEQTCSAQGVFLHSKYNPSKEAERFAQSIPSNHYKFIVVTEPALSYCAFFLRKSHPEAELVAIRFCSFFSESDPLWDHVLPARTGSTGERLYDIIGEENAGETLFLSWKPSEQPFQEAYTSAWEEIRAFGEKSRDVLATRSYFTPRWTVNSLLFCVRAVRCLTVNGGNRNIVIAASGPSLTPLLPLMNRDRSAFFLLAVSSALETLIHAGIVPDMVIATDGGYWAKKHLRCLENRTVFSGTVPLAASSEAAVPPAVFCAHPVLPLLYGDAVDSYLLNTAGIRGITAYRNGTVSGTAVQLAFSLTGGNVYLCGLDLAPNPAGYSHALPNALETDNETADTRVGTKEGRLAPHPNPALETYASWFVSRAPDFYSRLYRLRPPAYSYKRSLHPVREVSWEHVRAANTGEKPIIFSDQNIAGTQERKKNLRAYLLSRQNAVLKLAETKDGIRGAGEELTAWLKSASPGAYIRAARNGGKDAEELKNACAALLRRLFERLET